MPRNPNVIIRCQTCGEEFEVVFSLKDSAKYCGFECKRKSQVGKPTHNSGVFKATSYGACHHRVRRVRGTPSLCEVCGTTTAKKFEWANMTGNYEDVNDYKQMCTSCHTKHDGKVSNFRGKELAA